MDVLSVESVIRPADFNQVLIFAGIARLLSAMLVNKGFALSLVAKVNTKKSNTYTKKYQKSL